MADRGREIDEATRIRIIRLSRQGMNKTDIARCANVSRPTAYKYAESVGEKNLEKKCDSIF